MKVRLPEKMGTSCQVGRWASGLKSPVVGGAADRQQDYAAVRVESMMYAGMGLIAEITG